jgi:N-acetylneuraminic acid mutarotase
MRRVSKTLRQIIIVGFMALSGFSVSGQQWSIVEASGEVGARGDNGFMSCKGKFYLLGGRGEHPVDIFDPSTGIWSQGAHPPVEMHHFQAIRIEDEIWVLGAFTGEYPNDRPLEHIYIYNTENNRWRRGDPMPADRLRGSAGVVVYRERIYLICGVTDLYNPETTSWVDRYDPKTGKWKKLADAPRTRGHFQAGICNGKIYAAGGSSPSGSGDDKSGKTIAEVDVYDIESGRWKSLPAGQNLPTQRAACATVEMLDHIVVMGGENSLQEEAYNLVEAYDTERGVWEEWDTLENGRWGTQAFVCVGAIFITAGSSDREGNLADTSLEMLTF